TPITSQVTGSDGAYKFTDLVPGDYVVKFIASDGSILSTADVGTTDDLNDSDAGTSGFTGTYTLASGDDNISVDAGFYELASLGDKIWYDKDTDGVQDDNEAGISGLTVNLMGAGANNIFGDGDDEILATDTTDDNGNYLFTGLDPGNYQVQFSKPAGYVYTQSNQGSDDAKDSDAVVATGRSGTVNLESGESDLTVDAGVYKVGIDVEKYVSGTVCTTVNSCDGEGASASHWKNNYTNSWSGAYWSGTGCKLSDNFNTVFGTNCSGGNKSLYQVLCTTGGGQDAFLRECVAAYLNACHNKVSYAYTKEQVCAQTKYALSCGNYTETYNSFCKENSSGCDWGSSKETYNCTVDTTLYDADAPPGLQVKVGSTVTFTYIVTNTGDSALKDIKLVDDRIATVTYVSGDTNNNGWLDIGESWKYTAKETASAGTIKNTGTVTGTDAVGGTEKVTDKDDAYYTGFTTTTKASIGDKLWLDKDNDGIQESGEYGVGGVKVTLKGAGVDGVFGTDDDITATTTTNSKGNYIFNNLDAGKYQVIFNGVNGYAFTKQNQGSNDSVDSDVDSSGSSHIITLATGQQDLTVDAGIFCAKASVGNKVWDDMNHNSLQDSSEPGIAGITVTLYKADNTFVASMKTDDWGNYQFSNLDPGSYYLQFDKTNVLALQLQPVE
ncbi:SdrD B-like domain-containing protein, partial [Methylocucumis oryzae]